MNSHSEETGKRMHSALHHFERAFYEIEKVSLHLETQLKESEKCENELQIRQTQNETLSKKLEDDKRMIEKRELSRKIGELEKEVKKRKRLELEKATMEKKKADQSKWRLAQVHKEEKEKLHRKIIDLQKGIDAKQALELEMEQMRGTIQVMMKHVGEENVEVPENMDAIMKKIKEKEEEMDAMEAFNQILIVRERKSSYELQEARNKLINSLKEGATRAMIGMKRMGALDGKPFRAAAKAKFPAEEAEEKAVELCSLWEAYLRDPSWHPFKVLMCNDGHFREIIDVEDENLKSLKNEYGEQVYNAVTLALSEMNEYNPSGRYKIQELWNFKENRKATLKEGVTHLLNQWKIIRKRRRI